MKKSIHPLGGSSTWACLGISAFLFAIPAGLLAADDKKPEGRPARPAETQEHAAPPARTQTNHSGEGRTRTSDGGARPSTPDATPRTHRTPTDTPRDAGATPAATPPRTYSRPDAPPRTTSPDSNPSRVRNRPENTPTRTYNPPDSTPSRTHSPDTPTRTYNPGTPSRTYNPGGNNDRRNDVRIPPSGGRQFGGGRPTPGSVRTADVRGDHSIYRAPGGRTGYERQMSDGRRVYADSRGRGHIERTYVYSGRTVYQRVSYVNGVAYPRYYNPYTYRGIELRVYAPARYYRPAFYGWAYNPWAVPVVYSWGFASSPWYGYYGGYFTPYPTYASPSLWLTDYLIARNLEQSYQAQQQQQMMQQQSYAAPLTPDVKAQIAEEVRRQIQLEGSERQYAQSGVPDPAASSVAQMLQDNTAHVFVVSAPLTVPTGAGQCAVTEGDVLQLSPSQAQSQDYANLLVLASKGQDCPRGSMVSVGVADLQDMQNAMRQTIDQGMGQLQDNQGKNGLPALPLAASGPAADAAYASSAPPPDPNGAQQIAQEWDAGNRIDQAPPNNQADQPNPQPSDPVRVGIGMTMAEVESAMGRPATILAPPGNRIIYLYSNVKVTFIDGKVSDIQ